VIGWSDGGQLALRLAFTHPELVRRVVASGVGLGTVTPRMQQAMRALSADSWSAQVREEYARVSRDGAQHWPVIFDKIRTMWAKSSWGISEQELGRIKAAVMIVAGDRDFYARRGDHRYLPDDSRRKARHSAGDRSLHVSEAPGLAESDDSGFFWMEVNKAKSMDNQRTCAKIHTATLAGLDTKSAGCILDSRAQCK